VYFENTYGKSNQTVSNVSIKPITILLKAKARAKTLWNS
jgi:hypothetical protein